MKIIKEFCLTFAFLSFISVLRTLLTKDYLFPGKKCHALVVVKMELSVLGSIGHLNCLWDGFFKTGRRAEFGCFGGLSLSMACLPR